MTSSTEWLTVPGYGEPAILQALGDGEVRMLHLAMMHALHRMVAEFKGRHACWEDVANAAWEAATECDRRDLIEDGPDTWRAPERDYA